VSLDSLAPYFDAEGNLYVLVAASGEDEVPLQWVVIGGNIPPYAVLLSGPDSGPAPLEVMFYPIADHADPDGCLVYYEWDFQGDGVYEVAGADIWNVYYTYETPGEYYPVLRVTDSGGATATDTGMITVTAPEE
jgi:PKD repeat protein